MIPEKLKEGCEIRVIAPSKSLSIVSRENIDLAKKNLEKLGYVVTFSKNCTEKDIFNSSSIKSRIDDIHDAFCDRNVKAILTAIGGFNSNQLLDHLDYDLIRDNPKVICGYSDITALANAITSQTGLVTYSGLHFSTWAMEKEFDYNLEYFKKCLTEEGGFEIKPSPTWSDDPWFKNQEDRKISRNGGFAIINEGEANGNIFGGNLCTFNLLQGTRYMPDISGSILFIEDDDMAGNSFSVEFDRNLQSLIHQPGFSKVKGMIIGRFQKNTDMTPEKLRHIIDSKEELKKIPIVSNADFGHTNPMTTFPIGGNASLYAKDGIVRLKITSH